MAGIYLYGTSALEISVTRYHGDLASVVPGSSIVNDFSHVARHLCETIPTSDRNLPSGNCG